MKTSQLAVMASAGTRRLPGRRSGLAAVALAATGVLFAAGLPLASPAAAASPGCTVATATPLDLNVANAFGTVCPGSNYAYSKVQMGAGDTLIIDIDTRNLVANAVELDMYPVGTTDYTLSSTASACDEYWYKPAMSQFTCTVYNETGERILRWQRSQGLIATPRITAVPVQAGQTPGSCRIEAAPPAPNGVTQYASVSRCDPSDRWWTIALAAGDSLAIPMSAASSGNIELKVYQPGVNDFTLGTTNSWCGTYTYATTTLSCGVAPVAGNYLIRLDGGSGSFTPNVTAAPPPPPPAPAKTLSVRLWSYKKASRLEVDVDPNVGLEWKVRLQKLKNGVWKNSGSAKTTKSTHRKFNPKKGTYRVLVLGKEGYPTTASAAVYVRK